MQNCNLNGFNARSDHKGLILPVFGALPFVFAAPHAGYTDAFFEAMSGLTTTGATVFEDLDTAPRGMLLWRAMLQWFGGVGIVVVAMVFLQAIAVLYRSYLELIEGEESANKYLDKDSLGEGEEAYEGTH